MTIRKLRRWKLADAGWFRDLDYQCFRAPYQSFANEPGCHWWVVRDFSGRVMGYAGLRVEPVTARIVRRDRFAYRRRVPTRAIGHLTRCGVLPEFRGQAIQQRLIRERLRWCRRRGIKLVKTYAGRKNRRSIANLEACGFRAVAGDGEFLCFRKELA